MDVGVVAIGASLGGVAALSRLFAGLPPDFPIPIATVIHRGVNDVDYLISTLARSTELTIEEPYDKVPIVQGAIAVAPADYHLLVDGNHYALSADAPVNHARPSIDVLFESIADQYGSRAVGILLTGGGVDGVSGLLKIKKNQGMTFVQSPGSAVDPSLPAAAVKAEAAIVVDTVDNICQRLLLYCSRSSLYFSQGDGYKEPDVCL